MYEYLLQQEANFITKTILKNKEIMYQSKPFTYISSSKHVAYKI